jgi:hypothetical protein
LSTNDKLATLQRKLIPILCPTNQPQISHSGYLHLNVFSVPLKYLTNATTKDSLFFTKDFIWNYKTINPPLSDEAYKRLLNCITLFDFIKSLEQQESSFVYKAINHFDKLITPHDLMNQINNLQKLDFIQSTFKGNYPSKFFDAIKKRKSTDFDLLMKEMDAQSKEGDLLRWYYSKMIPESIKSNTQNQLKHELFIIFCLDILDQSSCPYEQHHAIENFVQILELDYLLTTNRFWTGAGMIPFNQIVAWYKRSKNKGTEFIIRQSPTEELQELQVIKSTMQLSTEARAALVQELEKNNQPTDKLSLAIQRLIRFVCPCKDTTQITFAYFNTDSGSFPFKFIIDIDQTWLKVEGLPNISVYILPKSEVPDETKTKIDRCISIHHLMRSIRGLKDEYNNKFYDQIVQHLANLSPALTTDGVMSAVDETQKLIDKCLPLHSEERLTQLFTEFFTPPQPPKPTPTLETKESICTREFTCQLFIVITKEANETFESIAQKIITEVGDKGKPHFLLFGDRLWVSVDGMSQPDLNALYEKLFGDQREFIISSRYEHTPHISPCMLRNGKPFEFNVVPIEKDASFFIHGDSASEWDNLYERLIQEVPESQTLMFNTRKRGRVPGHTLYVRTKRMKFSSPHQLLQKIDTIVKTWKHNDTELVKEFNHSQ